MNRMMAKTGKILRMIAVSIVCLGLASCEEPRVYGSVGFSSYSGGWGGGGMGTSVTIGGRIR
jgi:hypothetical protein